LKNDQKITITKAEKARPIEPQETVRLTQMNHILEVLHMAVEPTGLMKIKKLDKHHYLNLETNEIHKYTVNENRSQSYDSLKATFKRLRHLINNNFVGAANEVVIGLTYTENMTDTKKLMTDFEQFWKRFKRKYEKEYQSTIDYLSVVEPQERGAWHIHLLVRFNDRDSVFLDPKDLKKLWGNSKIHPDCRRLEGVDNVGAYLTAYLCNVPFTVEKAIQIQSDYDNRFLTIDNPDETMQTLKLYDAEPLEIIEREVTVNGKKERKWFIKNGRLNMYPSGMNLYRKSKGIIKPETVKMRYCDVKEIVGSTTPDYSKTIYIDKDDRPLNTVTYEHYNKIRNKCK
jgi:hypothetical protein